MTAWVLAIAVTYLLVAAVLLVLARRALRRLRGGLTIARIRLLNARLWVRGRRRVDAAIAAEDAAVKRARALLEEAG
jgi:hypothetical protein